MRYVVIDPYEKLVKAIDASSYDVAVDRAGLRISKVDHGRLSVDLAIVVDEHSLFRPVNEQKYFSIGDRLFAGKALLYAFDDYGETIDVRRIPDVKFFTDAKDVESAISAGTVRRPHISFNGVQQWAWPEPAPPELYP